ncbi:hypothetical protein ASPACDRAFT_1883135 [Aspergillus aculeatus ATCC 16872]|uniref:Uncharacterized protein n=1 Tax=Aspergillus aculeatus (strain ATCC 16872 / CBS 172.66 / WB 5094) TaxID=690307 RepID=A0A1L9WI63_ASPA1|nr:uncharacterized protein ASPACDRAFT_1883135 [Aspergillus aculeatus ATCC 16872]OJJ95858.1 hypothetical protein ASPACDRAFT_1883135 [Aspergillus aculeatus ATCC 16872]
MPTPGHVHYITLDVFTNTAYTGNPLAVVFLPPSSSSSSTSSNTTLTQRQKQTLAREFNFSETIFIHPDPSSGTNTTHRTIDIFTPTEELPFAGHPTIGAAAWFLHLSENPPKENAITHLITKSGTIPIARCPATSPAASETTSGKAKGEGVTARIAHNPHVHAKRFPLREVLRLHGSLAPFLAQKDSDRGAQGQHQEGISFPVFSIVKGMSQVLVEVPSLAALAAVTTSAGGEMVGPESGYMDVEGGWAVGLCVLYFYVRGVQDDDQGKHNKEVIRTRAIFGNVEDPATGSAACGLAAYLSLTQGTPKERRGFDFVQGVEMGRRSEIGVEVEMGDDAETIAHVDLKGNAVKVSEGSIAIPPE